MTGPMEQSFDKHFKIILIGDSGVGKSSILHALVYNSTTDVYPTIGIDYAKSYIYVNDNKIKLSLWDTAGQERFKSLISVYYRGVDAIIMIYDITNRQTFKNIDYWIRETMKYCNDNVVTMLIGNKRDLVENREITYEEARLYAEDHDLLFMETSATTLEGIENSFVEIAKLIDKNGSLQQPNENKINISKIKTKETTCDCS